MSLSKLAIEMQKCEITLSKMGYSADLDNSENLHKIVRRLPMHAHANLIESGVEPKSSHLINFIEQRAKVANNVYRRDLAETNGTFKPKSQSSLKPAPTRRTFVTNTESTPEGQGHKGQTSNGRQYGSAKPVQPNKSQFKLNQRAALM